VARPDSFACQIFCLNFQFNKRLRYLLSINPSGMVANIYLNMDLLNARSRTSSAGLSRSDLVLPKLVDHADLSLYWSLHRFFSHPWCDEHGISPPTEPGWLDDNRASSSRHVGNTCLSRTRPASQSRTETGLLDLSLGLRTTEHLRVSLVYRIVSFNLS
jgi:hypothetical protein